MQVEPQAALSPASEGPCQQGTTLRFTRPPCKFSPLLYQHQILIHVFIALPKTQYLTSFPFTQFIWFHAAPDLRFTTNVSHCTLVKLLTLIVFGTVIVTEYHLCHSWCDVSFAFDFICRCNKAVHLFNPFPFLHVTQPKRYWQQNALKALHFHK